MSTLTKVSETMNLPSSRPPALHLHKCSIVFSDFTLALPLSLSSLSRNGIVNSLNCLDWFGIVNSLKSFLSKVYFLFTPFFFWVRRNLWGKKNLLWPRRISSLGQKENQLCSKLKYDLGPWLVKGVWIQNQQPLWKYFKSIPRVNPNADIAPKTNL